MGWVLALYLFLINSPIEKEGELLDVDAMLILMLMLVPCRLGETCTAYYYLLPP